DLLLHYGRSFRRDPAVRQPVADHRRRHRRALNFPPELQPPIAEMLSNRVDGDSHQPGVQGRIAPEGLSVTVGIPEAVLSKRLSDVPIAYGSENESNNPRPVKLDDPVEVLNLRHRVVDTRGNERGRNARVHTIV